MSLARVWPRLYPTQQSAAASAQSRRAGGTREEQTFSLQYLWKRIRHGVEPEDSHVQGRDSKLLAFLLLILMVTECMGVFAKFTPILPGSALTQRRN